MKNNVTLILAAAFIGLFAFALIEKAKWSKNKSVAAQVKVVAPQSPATTADTNSATAAVASPSTATMDQSQMQQAVQAKQNEIEAEGVWIMIELSALNENLAKIKSELESRLIQSRQISHKYSLRFVSQAADVSKLAEPQFKLIGQIEQDGPGKWILTFKMDRLPDAKQVAMTSQKKSFPLPNPLPNYKMKIDDVFIASQMSAVLIKAVKSFHELELAKKSTHIKTF